jgi:hypothetical protein
MSARHVVPRLALLLLLVAAVGWAAFHRELNEAGLPVEARAVAAAC